MRAVLPPHEVRKKQCQRDETIISSLAILGHFNFHYTVSSWFSEKVREVIPFAIEYQDTISVFFNVPGITKI